MSRSNKYRSRRMRKKLRRGEFQDRPFPTNHAISERLFVFTFDDGRTEKVYVYIWAPHEVAEHHWRCPFLIQGESLEKGAYSPGADSMQALILATHSILSQMNALARIHAGAFSLDGGPDLGLPYFGKVMIGDQGPG